MQNRLTDIASLVPHSSFEARYQLGVSSNLFSEALPEGCYYPDFVTLTDHRPEEFIALFGQIKTKPWSKCTILDLGCGEGTSTIALGRTGARVIGLEGRVAIVRRATYLRDRLGYGNVEFRVGNVTDPSLWTEVDAVFASGLIHHLASPFALMELIGNYCRDFAYFCTHLAPADDAMRQQSYFEPLLSEPGSVDFRGRSLPGIRFKEDEDLRELRSRRFRHPRSGIANTHSWWPTESAFFDAMKAVGFPHARRITLNEHRLRYRLAFSRNESVPETAAAIEPSLWPTLARPDGDAAARRALFADVTYLRTHRVEPVIVGERDAAAKIYEQLVNEGINPTAIYLPEDADLAGAARDLATTGYRPDFQYMNQLEFLRPNVAVIATLSYENLRRHIGELSTMENCAYAISSFALAAIPEFPAVMDPITGIPFQSLSNACKY